MISFPERSPSQAVISAFQMVIWVTSLLSLMEIKVGYIWYHHFSEFIYTVDVLELSPRFKVKTYARKLQFPLILRGPILWSI
jgi:hypothetical protein